MGFDVDSDAVENVVSLYGADYMADVAIEEPAELIQAICKVCPYLDPKDQ